MPAFNPNTQKILYYDPDQSRSTVSSFAEDIHAVNTESSFTIFLVAEIRNQDHVKNQYFLRELQNTFSRYFKSQQTRLTESSFEEGLHQLNKVLPTLFADRSPSFIDSLSFVAGALSGHDMHFSQVGPATILFIQHGSVHEIGDHSLSANKNPLKLFKEIASGKIEQDDIVFISTTNFLDYFSQEKIKRILEEHISNSIAKGFDEYLLQAPTTTSFAALSITLHPGHVKTVNEFNEETAQHIASPYSRSMETLIEREQNTEEILSPKLLPFLRRKIKLWALQFRSVVRKNIFKKPTRISPIITEKEEKEVPLRYSHKEKGAVALKARGVLIKLWHKISFGLKTAQSKTTSGVKNITTHFPHQKNTEQRNDLAPAIRSLKSVDHKTLFQWFARLQRKRRVFLITAILLVALFSQSIIVNGVRQQRADKNSAEQALQAQIQKAMDDIDAALLYGDDNRIQTTLNELRQELETIQNTKGNDDLISQIQQAISSSERRLQKIRDISNPTLLADVSLLAPSTRLTQASLLDSVLVTLDPAQRILITTNIENGESEKLSAVTSETQAPILMTSVSDTSFILNQELSLSKFESSDNQVQAVSFTPPSDTANLASMASYSGKLYFVDIHSNQILKSFPSGNGYSRPTPWLKNETDLSLANSIAIDGSIYVGFQNGTIQKFTQGEEDTFSMPTIQPALEHINGLWTDETTSSLYVFDAEGSRVLVINKNNGNLLQQFIISGTDKLETFSVSESAQKIFIISSSKIYSVPFAEN
ncbi:MAG: hypothetical protein WC495_00475 [Patescibacteria group bacterium]